jgi:hypothetical protein
MQQKGGEERCNTRSTSVATKGQGKLKHFKHATETLEKKYLKMHLKTIATICKHPK